MFQEGFFFDTYKRIDESRYCDEVIKQLWEKTQNYDFKTTEELLKILESIYIFLLNN